MATNDFKPLTGFQKDAIVFGTQECLMGNNILE